MKLLESLRNMRRLPERWRRAGLVLAGLLLCEIGARVGAPGVVGDALSQYFRRGGTGLLWLYDRLVGGAISRGAVLALGIMPYVSARILVRLARIVSPAVDQLHAHAEGRTRLTRWTRVLTVGLSLVQSYGYARLVQTLPGVVAIPGPGFVAQTMLVLTGGAVAAMLLGEQISALGDTEESLGVPEQDVRQVAEAERPTGLAAQQQGSLLLPSAAYAPEGIHERRREPVRVPSERMRGDGGIG